MTKIETGYRAEPHRHLEKDARHLDAPLLQLDLPAEATALRRAGMGPQGHVAKTLSKHADLRLVLIALDPGGRLDKHQTPGRVHIQVLDGRVAIHLNEQVAELSAGGLLEIAPTTPHELVATTQSTILLTIAWPKKE